MQLKVMELKSLGGLQLRQLVSLHVKHSDGQIIHVSKLLYVPSGHEATQTVPHLKEY